MIRAVSDGAHCVSTKGTRKHSRKIYIILKQVLDWSSHRPLTTRTGKLLSNWQPIEIGDQEDVDMLLKPSLWEELTCSQEQLAVGDDLHFYHTEKEHNLSHRYKNEILKKKEVVIFIIKIDTLIKILIGNGGVYYCERVYYIHIFGHCLQQKSTRFLKPNSCISNIPSIFC